MELRKSESGKSVQISPVNSVAALNRVKERELGSWVLRGSALGNEATSAFLGSKGGGLVLFCV